MKVPTFQKYGISRSQFEKVENKTRRVTHFLTHQFPMLFGLAAGILIYLSVSKKFSPTGIQHYIQQFFILAAIIVISIGISMLIFKGLNYLYHSVRKKTSPVFQKAIKYEMDKERYDFWKLRFDEEFWGYMDGLSVEKEILNLYKMLGYSLKSEISTRPNRLDYILINHEEHTIYLRCYSSKSIENLSELDDVILKKRQIRTDEIHIVSIKGFNKKMRSKFSDPKIKLFSPKEISSIVRNQLEKK